MCHLQRHATPPPMEGQFIELRLLGADIHLQLILTHTERQEVSFLINIQTDSVIAVV